MDGVRFMNVLIAADYATPASGNFIASCVELGRYLKNKGDNLFFIFPENANTLSEGSWVKWLEREGFVVELTTKDKTESQKLDFLKSFIKKYNIDILHIHFGFFHHTVNSFAGELGVKILVHDHMDFSVEGSVFKQKIRCGLTSLIYRKNKITVVSVNPQKDSSYVFARHKYVPNGLSLLRNVSVSASRDECRAEIGITPDEKLCLFMGWDIYRKGLDIAVRAVNELRKDNPKILLGVVGMGSLPSSDSLKIISERTGIDPNSDWIRYLPSREDMFAYHRAADAYLSASRKEAFSYGILEAISQNVPVAVSDIKGTSWCHDYDKVVIYSTENHKDCADAINNAIALGNSPSNYRKIVDEYSVGIWCERIYKIYQEL